jgi:hypothetical protein
MNLRNVGTHLLTTQDGPEDYSLLLDCVLDSCSSGWGSFVARVNVVMDFRVA